MTITLPGYANPIFLGQKLAEQFPAMQGQTQVIRTSSRKTGPQVTVFTNAQVDATAVKTFIIDLSQRTVADTQAIETVLTPDQQPKARR